MPGAEVVQLYVRDQHASNDNASQELKAFARVTLQPNQEKNRQDGTSIQAPSLTMTCKRIAGRPPSGSDWCISGATNGIYRWKLRCRCRSLRCND
ncbi:MAG: fibronectin type III-like domain-contianing protein [Chthonomonadales bacterium]